MLRLLSLLVPVLAMAIPAFAQQERVNFIHYPTKDGLLPNPTLMVQDKDGFLWVGGPRGLARFDGYEFVNFNEALFDSPPYRILSLLADGEYLWVGTENKGLARYHPAKNELKVYKNDPQNPNSLPSDQISQLYKDSQNRLWVGTWFGLCLMRSAEDGIFDWFPFQTEGSKTIYNYSRIEKILEDRSGNIWVGTWGGGLHKFHPETKVFEHFENLKGESNTKKHWIKDLYAEGNHLWVATIGDGLFRFDTKTYLAEQFQFYPNSLSKGYARLLSIYPRSKQELWIGSEEGLIRFQPGSGTYEVIKDNGPLRSSLLNRLVERIFEDNHRGIWILAGGLNYYNYGADKFTWVVSAEGNPKENEVHGFFDHSPEELWISTSAGLRVYNPSDGTFKNGPKALPGIAHKMLRLRNGQIASISTRDGFSLYDPKTNQLRNYQAGVTDLQYGLISNVLHDMAEDSVGNVWIAGISGLSCFRQADEKFFHISRAMGYSKGLKTTSLVSTIIDPQGKLWLFSQTDQIKPTFFHPNLFKAGGPSGILTDSSLYAFQYGFSYSSFRHTLFYKGSFYAAQNNVVRFSPQTGQWEELTDNLTLLQRDIKGMEMDDQDGLWISTGNGLLYLNLRTQELASFYENDGLQANGFNPFAIRKTKDGSIYVGGNNGFNIIKISDIELNDYAPPIRITGLAVFNKPVKAVAAYDKPGGKNDGDLLLSRDVAYETELVISHRQNLVSFDFSALNYLYPQENRYTYKMEGVDNEWITTRNRRSASYANLPEGTWLTFRVKGANNNGIWGQQEARIRLFINPPFWNTLWFRVVGGLLLGIMVVVVYRARVSQLKEQRNLLEQQVKERTQEIRQKQEEIERQNHQLVAQSEDLRIQNSNALLFSEMGKKITASISLDEIFQRIYQLLNDSIDATHMGIGEVNEQNQSIAYWEIIHGKASRQSISMDEEHRLSVYVVKRNTPIFSNNLTEDVRLYLSNPSAQYQQDALHSAIYIPLQSPGQNVSGVLVVKSTRRGAYEQKTVNLLKNIAVYISIAMDNSHKYQKIQEQSEQLAQLDKIKTRFYTNISHEFRTPLTLIMGPVEALRKGKNLTLKEREYLQIVHQNATRLLRLVTQIMDLSKLEDGVLRLEVAEAS